MNDQNILLLKDNWDLSWSNSLPENEDGNPIFPIFSGKDFELSRLSGIISNGNGGVVFVGGANGAGKTSFAYKAIYTAKEFNKKIVCVPINNLILNPKDIENNQLVYETLKQMIRSAVKNEELKEKSNYSKLIELKTIISLTTYIRKLSEEESKEINKEINSGIDLVQILKTVPAFLIAIIPIISKQVTIITNYLEFVLLKIKVPFSGSFAILLTAVGLFFASVKSIDYAYSKISKFISKTEETYEIKGMSIHELEQRFNKILSELEGIDTEIVFLFEELDHFDWVDGFENNKLLDIFKSLKSLFHNSRALFVFLVGEKSFRSLSIDPYRTIPTETFLIPKATPTVLLDYLRKCMDLDEKENKYDREFALLIYKSQGNFYNLKKIIRESRKFENGKEYLLLKKLSDDDAFKASILLASFPLIEPYEIEERDIILEALMIVVKHFDQSLMLNPVNHIVIPNLIKSNENATKVMVAFIQHLFTIGKTFKSNLVIPQPNDPHNPLNIGDIIWQNLRDSLPNADYSYLYKDQVGVILPEEEDFKEKYNILREKIDKIKGIGNLNFGQAMQKLQDTYGFPSNASVNELIANTKTTLDLIENKSLKERGEGWFEQLSQQFIPQVQRLSDSIDKHIKLNADAIVVIGEAEAFYRQNKIYINLENRSHQAGQEFASLIKFNKRVPKSFFKKFNLDVKNEGVVNILLGMNEWTPNSIDHEFLMVRFDNRTNGTNGIFKKSSGSRGWGASEHMLEKNERPFSNQYVTLRVMKNNRLLVYYPNGKLNIRIDKIKWIGLANELTEATATFSKF